MLFVGADWSEARHDMALVDERGQVLQRLRTEPQAASLGRLKEVIASFEPDPSQVLVAIETRHSVLVPHLLEAGYTVYPINPKAVDRYRDRFRVSGASSDVYDAEVLAHILRTDRHRHRPLHLASELVEELKILTRHRESLVEQRTALLLRLRHALLSFYPQALELFGDLSTASTLVFLERYPSPELAGRASVEELEKLWREAGAHRGARERAERVRRVLRGGQYLRAPRAVRAGQQRVVRDIVVQLLTLRTTIRDLDRDIESLFREHPDNESILSHPGLGAVTAARVLSETGDRPADFFDVVGGWQAYAGTAPITIKSGKGKPIVKARIACNKHLLDACWTWAFCSLQRSSWAREFYDEKRTAGNDHAAAVRALANRWLEVLWAVWNRGQTYSEAVHMGNRRAAMAVAA